MKMTLMKIYSRFAYLLVVMAVRCAYANDFPTPVDEIIYNYTNATEKTVLVAAHRGEHHKIPENSMASLQETIAVGADIIEIDIRKTKDGKLILMHDATIDRTTNGKGKVAELTYAQLQEYNLKYPDGLLSDEKIPLLIDIMTEAKDKIMVNLDKAQDILPECIEILNKTGTQKQVLLKGTLQPEKVNGILDASKCTAFYMPIISSKKKEDDNKAYDKFVNDISILKPEAVEVVFRFDETKLLSEQACMLAEKLDTRLWVNSLNGIGCGTGKTHEDKAAIINYDAAWGWLINKGFTIIQTDEPEMLIKYLRNKKLHK